MANGIRFVALPVNQGDAFLLERADKKSVLVDGGKSKVTFPALLSRENSQQLDVVVCTHADSDHAEGIAGLLADGSISVSEVWLPGRWMDRLQDLCTKSEEFVHELLEDIGELRPTDLERYGEDLATSRDREHLDEVGRRSEEEHRSDGGRTESDLEWEPDDELAHALGSYTEGDYLDLHLDRWGPPWSPLGWFPVFRQAIDIAQRIRSIAVAAHHHGARIRWFDFAEYQRTQNPSGGEPLFLEPLNSVEITSRRPRFPIRALQFLALSVANRESLVFMAPETNDDPATLFCADSDMKFPIPNVKSGRTMIATAPHHGSEANQAAYPIVQQATRGSVQWLRSDGKFPKRPGRSFLAQSARSCTLCRGSKVPKQAVRLTAAQLGWTLDVGVRACNCQ